MNEAAIASGEDSYAGWWVAEKVGALLGEVDRLGEEVARLEAELELSRLEE